MTLPKCDFQNNLVVARAVNVNLQDGDWHFLLVTLDAGQVQFYVDGQMKGFRWVETVQEYGGKIKKITYKYIMMYI